MRTNQDYQHGRIVGLLSIISLLGDCSSWYNSTGLTVICSWSILVLSLHSALKQDSTQFPAVWRAK